MISSNKKGLGLSMIAKLMVGLFLFIVVILVYNNISDGFKSQDDYINDEINRYDTLKDDFLSPTSNMETGSAQGNKLLNYLEALIKEDSNCNGLFYSFTDSESMKVLEVGADFKFTVTSDGNVGFDVLQIDYNNGDRKTFTDQNYKLRFNGNEQTLLYLTKVDKDKTLKIVTVDKSEYTPTKMKFTGDFSSIPSDGRYYISLTTETDGNKRYKVINFVSKGTKESIDIFNQKEDVCLWSSYLLVSHYLSKKAPTQKLCGAVPYKNNCDILMKSYYLFFDGDTINKSSTEFSEIPNYRNKFKTHCEYSEATNTCNSLSNIIHLKSQALADAGNRYVQIEYAGEGERAAPELEYPCIKIVELEGFDYSSFSDSIGNFIHLKSNDEIKPSLAILKSEDLTYTHIFPEHSEEYTQNLNAKIYLQQIHDSGDELYFDSKKSVNNLFIYDNYNSGDDVRHSLYIAADISKTFRSQELIIIGRDKAGLENEAKTTKVPILFKRENGQNSITLFYVDQGESWENNRVFNPFKFRNSQNNYMLCDGSQFEYFKEILVDKYGENYQNKIECKYAINEEYCDYIKVITSNKKVCRWSGTKCKNN